MKKKSLIVFILVLLIALMILPAQADILPPVVDYQKYVTLVRHQTGGGCAEFTAMHIIDIEKEREFEYTPDLSWRFLNFVYNCGAKFGYCNTTENRPLCPNVNDAPDQLVVLQKYGAVPETDFPTNFDPWYPILYDATYPSDEVFAKALNYKLGSYQEIRHPTVEHARLFLNVGPVYLSNVYPLDQKPGDIGHIVTLIGYNDITRKFKILNSWGGGSPPNEGIEYIDYSDFAKKSQNLSFSSLIRLFNNNPPTPLIDPYTARINITHSEGGRNNLIVKIGVKGQEPMIVWNQNNHRYPWGAPYDNLKQLTIDVPLPAYVVHYWPPDQQLEAPWYISVTDTANTVNKEAIVNEITFAHRYIGIHGKHGVATYRPVNGPWLVPKHDNIKIYFDHSEVSPQLTAPNGGETWQAGTTHTIRWTPGSLAGTNVKLDLYWYENTFLPKIYQSTIAPSVPATPGIYYWTIPANQPVNRLSSFYRVDVRSLSYPGLGDMSDGGFRITYPTPTSITVTSPNGGETWQRGTTHTVTWDYTGSPGTTVKLILLKAGAEVGTIVSDVSTGTGGKGSYTWNIGTAAGLSTGSDFKVKVQSLSQPSVTDSSNNNFNITPAGTPAPTITVTSPNGLENWQRGTTHTVTWSYTGSPGTTVKLVLLKAGTDVGTIASGVPLGTGGTGSYTWNIGTAAGLSTGSDFQVRVESLSQPTIKDASNAYFTLTPAGTATPTITVTSPNGGETWQRGTTQTVTWTYTGTPGTTVKLVLLKAGAEVGTIIPSTSIGSGGIGSYTWPIGSSPALTTGGDFKVKVQSISQPTVTDTSNNIFTLTH